MLPQVMAQLAHQVSQVSEPVADALWGVHNPGSGPAGATLAGLNPILGSSDAQLALSLLSLLPWLCTHFRHSPHAHIAALCILVRFPACSLQLAACPTGLLVPQLPWLCTHFRHCLHAHIAAVCVLVRLPACSLPDRLAGATAAVTAQCCDHTMPAQCCLAITALCAG